MGLTDDALVRVCYEANRALQYELNDLCPSEPLDATPDAREPYLRGIRAARQEHPDPAQQHANWVRDKIADGWVYGPVRNDVEKTHPNIVDYSELPEEERLKDKLFVAIVEAIGTQDG